MPIYEYECSNCHHTFDVIQKVSDEPVKQCPECAQNMAVRLVSAAGFQLKGTGWYATDFKTKGQPEKSKTTDVKSDTKTEAKTETKDPASVKSSGSAVKESKD